MVRKIDDTINIEGAVDAVKGGVAGDLSHALRRVNVHTADDMRVAEALLRNADRFFADAAADTVKQNIHSRYSFDQTCRPCRRISARSFFSLSASIGVRGRRRMFLP